MDGLHALYVTPCSPRRAHRPSEVPEGAVPRHGSAVRFGSRSSAVVARRVVARRSRFRRSRFGGRSSAVGQRLFRDWD